MSNDINNNINISINIVSFHIQRDTNTKAVCQNEGLFRILYKFFVKNLVIFKSHKIIMFLWNYFLMKQIFIFLRRS